MRENRQRAARSAAWILIAFLAIAGVVLHLAKPNPAPPGQGSPSSARTDAMAARFIEMEARADADLHAHFPAEVASQSFREALVAWGDDWNHSPATWAGRAARIGSLLWKPGTHRTIPPASPHPLPPFPWEGAAWREMLRAWNDEGWTVERSHWHLERWESRPEGTRAGVRFTLLARRSQPAQRASIEGLAWVNPAEWPALSPDPGPARTVELEELHVRSRSGAPAFEIAAEWELPVPPHTAFCDPWIALDSPEGPSLLAVGAATWFRWRQGRWQSEPLPGLPPERSWAAAVADWNHDRSPDLWLAGSDGLRVLPGPRWNGPGILLWKSPQRLPHPQSLAVADFDGDGDLDAFVGQYRLPYQGGQFPTPWHDAMDGFPAALLRNDGDAGWSDVTAASGLGPKARRRLYSASFADWNEDGRPDLALVSDFAGLDLFQNTGNGRFQDITPTLGTNRFGFGMGHLTGDINGDGRMDLLLVGMDSPVADRLAWTGQAHPGWPEDSRLRRHMTAGNRWLSWDGAGFQPMPGGESMARGGWAWSATLLDVDNDGWPEIHLANGHETLASTRDHDEVFWTRDLHAAGSAPDPVADAFFRAEAGRRAAAQASHGGWQHGALFENLGGRGWRESSWLLGSAILADQRNALALDFDHDGRMDLAVTTMEQWPTRRQRLILLANRSPNPGHWLGLHLADGPGTGAVLRLKAGGRLQERRLSAGESHRSQHVGFVHFGLGDAREVEFVEALAPGSRTWHRLHPTPAMDRWNLVRIAPRP